jgi:hypothetical protein
VRPDLQQKKTICKIPRLCLLVLLEEQHVDEDQYAALME